MRTCAKCGRANQPTRKYCTRCGASLIGITDEKKPAPAGSTREVGTVTTGEQAMASDKIAKPASTVPPVEDPETRLVRPSEVRTDRLRSADRHVAKTEFEKAKEVFEQAEEYGVEEGQAGIVETRMLRASEVRELLDSVAEMPQDAGFQAAPGPDEFGAPTAPAPTIPTPQDIEQSILGSKSSLVEKGPEPEPVVSTAPEPPGAPTPFSPVEPTKTPEVEMPTRPPAASAPASTPAAPAAPPPTPVAPPPTPVAPAPAPAATVPERPAFEPKPASDTLDIDLPDPAYRNDPKIKSIHVEIRQYSIDLQRLDYDLEGIRSQLDAEVDKFEMVADQKKTRYENLREQTLAAKKEAEQAKKEHSEVDKRRIKRISDEQKRIEKMQKQIKKAESARKKRIEQLEKEKQRAAEKAARG